MNHRTHMDKDMTDAERRLASLVMIGEVVAVNEAHARLKVESGGVLTNWLPFVTSRAGEDRVWHIPEQGEQVVVVSPCGDPTQGVVIGSLFRNRFPPPAQSKTVHRVVYQDGTTVEYDRAAHKLRVIVMGDVEINATGNISLKCGGTMSLDAADIAIQEGCEHA